MSLPWNLRRTKAISQLWSWKLESCDCNVDQKSYSVIGEPIWCSLIHRVSDLTSLLQVAAVRIVLIDLVSVPEERLPGGFQGKLGCGKTSLQD